MRPLIKPDFAREAEEELAGHLALHEDALVARGMSREAARDAARRRFGTPARIARECRDIDEAWYRRERRASMWLDLRQDARYAVRLLRRAPGFTLVAVITLALGIGAPTAIFSLANWALLRPIPGVERPSEVQQVWVGVRRSAASMSMASISVPNLRDIAPRLRTIALAGRQPTQVNLATPAAPVRLARAEFVSADYFPLLGVSFGEGRPFTPEEDAASGPQSVTIIAEGLARELRETRGSALGQVLTINGLPFTVVGVVARGFEGIDRFSPASLWLPGATQAAVSRNPGLEWDDRAGGGYLYLVGRLRNGATAAQADGELKSLTAWLWAQFPKENAKFERAALHVMGPIGEQPLGGRETTVRTIGLMLGASVLVLFIACSNVASLLLMRGLGRSGEVAVRKALGAGALRIVRQHLTEGLVLWLLGGTVGLLLVGLLVRSVEGGVLLGLRGPTGYVPLDARVVAFSVALSLVVGLVSTIVPALRASRAEANSTMKEAGAGSGPRSLRIGSVLTSLQLATSLTLVLGAWLLGATLRNLSAVEVGFDPSGVYSFMVRPGALGYSPGQAAAYREELARRLRHVPGVESVATSVRAPFVSSTLTTRVKREGSGDLLQPQATEVISTGYFETLRIPLLHGRLFSDGELGHAGAARPVLVVSAQFARAQFGTANAVGRSLEFQTMGRVGQRFEIIGVVGDVRTQSLVRDTEPMIYEPAALTVAQRAEAIFLVRARRGTDVASAATTIAGALNPALPILLPRSLQEAIDLSRVEWSVLARLMTALAAMAGLLAAVGLYGVMAFGVTARRKEFGIRLALGAAPSRLTALVLRRMAAIAGAGLVLGAGGGAALSRALESRLFGVTPFEPMAWGAASVLLIVLALLASWLPARRAARVPVMTALRAN